IYLLSVNGLTIVQGLLLAGLLGAGEYGLWGLLAISFGTLFALAAIGLDDKYIQQDHPDQQAAFEIAFTLQSMLCGVFTLIALVYSPYKLRLRAERGAIREYATFSWPLFIGSISAVLMFQVPLTLAARSIGAAAIGAITLASQITQYTRRVDDIVTHALYPA